MSRMYVVPVFTCHFQLPAFVARMTDKVNLQNPEVRALVSRHVFSQFIRPEETLNFNISIPSFYPTIPLFPLATSFLFCVECE